MRRLLRWADEHWFALLVAFGVVYLAVMFVVAGVTTGLAPLFES